MVLIRYCWCLPVMAAALLAASEHSSATKPAPTRTLASPSIVLITMDTTRADRMGFLGSKHGLTPNLDALAQQSAVFTHAYAQAPLTPTSHATILTGTYPQFHQVSDFRVPLAKDLPYAPEILRAHGYSTAAFVGSIVLDPNPSYAPGFDRGFDTYDAGFHYEGPGRDRYRTIERRGGEVVARALAWLNQHSKVPLFLWVHLYDPHEPYDPPEPYKSRYASQPYDGEIAYMDSALGKLLSGLKARGLYQGAVIAVMADHGESLGAHGEDTHGIFLYDETIQVPLLIKLPRGEAAGMQIENRVELVDVLPTLLRAVGIAVPPEVQGESFLELMKVGAMDSKLPADNWRDRPAYARTDYPANAFRWSALESLRAGKYLYVRAPKRELYDQLTDPKAERNLAATSAAAADTLTASLDAFGQKTSNPRETPHVPADPMAQTQLAALGYLASENAPKTAAAGQGADPKDKIEISNIFLQATSLRESGRFREAAALLEKLIAREPGLSGAYSKLGDNLLDMKEYQKAIPVLRKVVEMDPDSAMARFKLAKGLMGSGDFEGAVPELEFATARVPNFVDAHLFLEMAYARTNRVPETIKECKTVLQILPDHFGSYLILGRFLEMSGDLEGAITNLKRAAALEPKAPEPHQILADVYNHLDRKADAERESAIAQRLASHR